MRESSIVFLSLVYLMSALYRYAHISAVTSAYAPSDLMRAVMFANLSMQIRFIYGLASSARLNKFALDRGCRLRMLTLREFQKPQNTPRDF